MLALGSVCQIAAHYEYQETVECGKNKDPAGTFQQGLIKTDRVSLFAYSHRGHIKNLAAIVVAT
jgi:hypothetical protein